MIITLIFQIITDIVYTGASILFYSTILSMRYGRKKYISIFFPSYLLAIALPTYFIDIPQYIIFFFGMGVMIAGIFVFSNDKPFKIIVYGFIPYIGNIITSILYIFGRSMFMPEYMIVFGSGDYIDSIFFSLGNILFLLLAYNVIRRKKPGISDLSAMYIITTLLIQMIVLTFIMYVYTVNLNGTIFMLALISYMIISLILNIIVIRYIVHISREQSRQEIVSKQYELLCAQYGELRSSYVGYRKLRHDLKDHISVMQGLSRKGENDELTKYANDLIESWDDLSSKTFCDVPAVDIVITDKYNIASANGIKADFVVSGISEVGADSIYMCSIFSNLLNNALEATLHCKDKPFIELRSGIRLGNLIITCRNSMPQDTEKKKKTDRNGYGLSIISELSKLLNGKFVHWNDEETFTATVTIPVKIKEEITNDPHSGNRR